MLRTWLAVLVLGLAQKPQLPTPDIHYVPTSNGVAEAMLKLAKTTPDDVVYDLGSGDGRIPIAAAKKFGARGVGIEELRVFTNVPYGGGAAAGTVAQAAWAVAAGAADVVVCYRAFNERSGARFGDAGIDWLGVAAVHAHSDAP